MWAIQNKTPFAAERAWVRDKDGAEIWVVAVKATYRILPDGTTELAQEQEEVLPAPKYLGEPGQSSLLYEADLVRIKRTTDVLLHGHAYAAQPTKSLEVRMKVGQLEKCLRVTGDRIWKEGYMWGMRMSSPEPFRKMPIVYERACGGVDQNHANPKKHGWEPWNPIGTGYAVKSDHLLGLPVANVEYPQHLIESWEDKAPPAGFGPIPADWEPRLPYAGTFDENWRRKRQPLVPEDFDDRFFQCAPEDQQTPTPLKGGEAVELHNLTQGGLLRFNLPRAFLRFSTRFIKGGPVEHRAMLHTVILEPDVPRVIMVWHTAVPCHARVNQLLETVIRQKQLLSGIAKQATGGATDDLDDDGVEL